MVRLVHVQFQAVLLTVSELSKMYGADIVLEGVGFRMDRREKVALVGRNGSGKTTLLRVIAGDLEPDGGGFHLSRGAKVGYLKQESSVGSGRTVIEEAESALERELALKKRLSELERKLEDDPSDEDLDEYALVHEHFADVEGYSAEHDVWTVLQRMGFSEGDFAKATDSLSGGEKTRLAIARILLEEPDLLILDVRGNGGGRVFNLIHLSSFFLKRDQPLGTFVDRRTMERYKEDTGSQTAGLFEVAEWNQTKLKPMRRNVDPFAGEVVVLVDGATGSASEMIAAALRDQRDAKVVGMKSAGAALASTMRQLRDGYLLQFPLMDYVTIKGLRIEGNGVEPDVIAPRLRFGEKDIGVAEAIRVFKESRDGLAAA